MSRSFIILLLLALPIACSRPIVRSDEDREAPSHARSDEPNYEVSDLKKRLWILPFLEAKEPSPMLADTPVADLMQPKIID